MPTTSPNLKEDDLLSILREEAGYVREEMRTIVDHQQKFRVMSLTFTGLLLPAIIAILSNHEKINSVMQFDVKALFPILLSIVSVFYMSIALSYNILASIKRGKTDFLIKQLKPKIESIVGVRYLSAEEHHNNYLRELIFDEIFVMPVMWSATNFVIFVLPALIALLVSFIFVDAAIAKFFFYPCLIINIIIFAMLYVMWAPRVKFRK